MDSWKHCPNCNSELTVLDVTPLPFYCQRCGDEYSRSELELLYENELKKKRLVAVRNLVKMYENLTYSKLIIADLAAVWPEAVDADETSQALRDAGYGG